MANTKFTGWRRAWRWPWAGALPRKTHRVWKGLERIRSRRARGKVWVAKFAGERYTGSFERTRGS